jgi:hypothetical protein
MDMEPQIKERWIAALRSGKYLQGARQLRYRDARGALRHCCLGVLNDLAVQDGITTHSECSGDAVLSDEVVEWSGITDYGGSRPHRDISHPTEDDALWKLNDLLDFPFEWIANVIEKEF